MSEALRAGLRAVGEGLVEREALVELVVLAAVAREHLLVIGPPGTAKSEAVRRVAALLGGRTFEYLLGRFTEPSEIFGPVDLQKLQRGLMETKTEGMLPEAEFAFLDEIFLGSTAILNTLLGILNERTFRRGSTAVDCPLRVCVGASNELPSEPALAAFADRFLLRVFVDPLPDPRLEDLLEGGWRPARSDARVQLSAVDELAERARGMDLGPLRPELAMAVRSLRAAGIQLSDRRVVKLQRLAAAAAALAGRQQPTPADLWPIVHAVPTAEGQALAREVLREQLDAADNVALPNAAEEAARSQLARARRLAEAAEELLGKPENLAWRLKVEGLAREVDATFDPDALPEPLAAVRLRLVAALGSGAGAAGAAGATGAGGATGAAPAQGATGSRSPEEPLG